MFFLWPQCGVGSRLLGRHNIDVYLLPALAPLVTEQLRQAHPKESNHLPGVTYGAVDDHTPPPFSEVPPTAPTFVFYKAVSLYENQYKSGLRVLQAMDKIRFWESCVFKGALTLPFLGILWSQKTQSNCGKGSLSWCSSTYRTHRW